MKHFRKIQSEIDVKPFVEELNSFSGVWDEVRGQTISVQRETLDIPLRKRVPEEGVPTNDCQKSAKTEWYSHFPKLTSFLENLQTALNADLSRVMIVTLRPRGRVYRHRDDGSYYALRDRYHLVLHSDGSDMTIEDEHVVFKAGELWWYDNKGYHESQNNSDKERIHVIFDMLPRKRRANFLSWIGLQSS